MATLGRHEHEHHHERHHFGHHLRHHLRHYWRVIVCNSIGSFLYLPIHANENACSGNTQDLIAQKWVKLKSMSDKRQAVARNLVKNVTFSQDLIANTFR